MPEHAKKFISGRITPSGRINLPVEFRRAIGAERGGDVVVELDGDEIRIRTIHAAVARSQALARRLFGDNPAVSSDAFLAERKRSWGEE
jgi:bifunctional DNA-binding transcriptional regulator/antitoxin component of YhaV-PrlF toxin-antitoxin module